MEEKSLTRNHGAGIVGRGESWRRHRWERNHGEVIIEEGGMLDASGRHLGSLWEASGRHLGGIWEASGEHPTKLFPPSLSKKKRKLTSGTINSPFMEQTRYAESASKENEACS
jgi:hypothetical protein